VREKLEGYDNAGGRECGQQSSWRCAEGEEGRGTVVVRETRLEEVM